MLQIINFVLWPVLIKNNYLFIGVSSTMFRFCSRLKEMILLLESAPYLDLITLFMSEVFTIIIINIEL